MLFISNAKVQKNFGIYVQSHFFVLSFQQTFYLAQRLHDELTLLHQRMWNLQIGLIDLQVIVKQYVDVNGTIVVDGSFCLMLSFSGMLPHLAKEALDELRAVKHLSRCLAGLYADNAVDEAVLRLKAPRLGVEES